MALSLPGFDYSILAWIGLAPYLYALQQRGLWGGAVLGFIFGYFYGLGTFYWLPLTEDVSLPQFIFLIVPTFSMFYVPFGLVYRIIYPAIGFWIILAAPALWVASEYARANLFFLSLPWNFLGHSQYQHLSLIQIADVTGMYGISFVIVMVNQFLSGLPEIFLVKEKISMRKISKGFLNLKTQLSLLVTEATVVAALLYGMQKISIPPVSAYLRVALVQANVVARDRMSADEQRSHLNAYYQLSLQAARNAPDIIIWPASSLPASITSQLVRKSVANTARESGTYLLVGGAGVEKFGARKEAQIQFSNSEFLYASNGRIVQKYNKIHLVPFDEYIPLENKITWPEWVTSLKFSFIRGKEYTLFEVKGTKFGTPICWENLFSDQVRRFVKAGANFIVNVTNEGYTGRTNAPYQTTAMAVFRAVENRVPVLRAATTGVSCYISPNGEIVDRIRGPNGNDLFVSGILVKDVPLHTGESIYTEHGDVFALAAVGVVVLCLLFTLYERRRRHNGLGS